MGEMTQKLAGKHDMYSSLLLLPDMGETATSEQKRKKKKINFSLHCSPSPSNMSFFHILRQ